MSQMWSYVNERNERAGPVSGSELSAMLRQGDLSADTLVWTAGFADWKKAGEVPELNKPVQPQPDKATNLLTRRFSANESASAAGGMDSGIPHSGGLGKKIFLLLVAGLAVLWANSRWHFIPGTNDSAGADSEYSDRWFPEDNSEGAIIQVEFVKRRVKGDKRGYALKVVVSAGRPKGRRLPVDKSSSLCEVIIKDADGRTVLNEKITTAKLCPS